MLSILFIAALQFATANGAFLRDCPLNGTERVDQYVVVDTLRLLYDDLIRTKAMREWWYVSGLSYDEGKRLTELFVELSTNLTLHHLEGLHEFAKRVDHDYGVMLGPDLALLRENYQLTKNDVSSSVAISSKMISRVEDKNNDPEYGASYRRQRHAYIDTPFTAREGVSVKDIDQIFCEFVLKIKTLDLFDDGQSGGPLVKFLQYIKRGGRPRDFSDVISQAKQIDPDFARELDRSVVRFVDTTPQQALENADAIIKRFNDNQDWFNPLQSFTKWFKVMAMRRWLGDGCPANWLAQMNSDVRDVMDTKFSYGGVSLNKVHELEAGRLLKSIICLHVRLDLYLQKRKKQIALRLKAANSTQTHH